MSICERQIIVEHRRMLFSEKSDIRPFMPGATIADIVSAFDKPAEFEEFGAVYFKHCDDDLGDIVSREYWHRVRPKSGASLFISCVPQNGGSSGGGGKNVFALVAAIALVALTVWIGGGGLFTLLAPTLGASAAYTVGVVGAAAIGIAGSAALQLLSKPAAGTPSLGSPDSSQASLGVAGISQNPLKAYQQIPAVRGVMRVSPGLLARPYTTIENNDQVLWMICGAMGPCDISSIKINETDIADLPSGVLDYETREGWDDDAPLTLITGSAFQENINLEMSRHRVDIDQLTLIETYTSSYPKAHILRSARNTDRFRVTLGFPSGLAYYNSGSEVAVAFRIRVRRVGDSTWINLPECHLNAVRRAAMRQEIWFIFDNETNESNLIAEVEGEQTSWKRCYYQNPEWTANSYFNGGAAAATDSNVRHVFRGQDQIFFHLLDSTFPVGQYDIEITRGFADAASGYSDTSYTTGMFTFRTFVNPSHTIPSQADISHTCAIENYTSFRDEYPIAQRGLSLIAIKARNLQVNSLSAIFGSYVATWDGADWDTIAVSSNPAALLRDTLTGNMNARALTTAQIGTLTDWYDHCVAEGLTCNHVVTDGSVEQAATLIAACGDAALRRSDKWDVVIDKDRSAEPVTAMFTSNNMTAPLTIKKAFITGARALVPSFTDSERDYASRELDAPIYDDGVASDDTTLTEAVPYDGLVTEALVTRRARLDLRRARMRTRKYSFECHLSHIKSKKGDLIGLQHDILTDHIAVGRVKSFHKIGGNIYSVTLNTDLPDLPTSSYASEWDIPDVWGIGNVWDMTARQTGMQIELEDSSVTTIPVASIDGRTLIVDGTVAFPTGLKATSSRNGGSLVAVGPLDSESRRVILATITPKADFRAQIEAIDEAPEIFTGL